MGIGMDPAVAMRMQQQQQAAMMQQQQVSHAALVKHSPESNLC